MTSSRSGLTIFTIAFAAALTTLLVDQAAAQRLNRNEAKGTHLSGRWRAAPGLVTHGPDGKIIFLYGEIQPSIVCSPLQVCDIELQPGEVVRDVLVGDTVRWKVEPATSGAPGGQAIHLIVKPAESRLVTSMIVTTSRRTYHLQLKSHATQYMARVAFEYPEDVGPRMADINARLEASTIPGANVSAEQLNFEYYVSGNASWRPTRVYSDGQKTYIQFPSSLAGVDAPVLFAISGGENRIVNYRMKGSLMIVDYHIDEAVLVSGVGWWTQEKITIRRGG
ncbi:MAG: P-type conjugative transfer protein TrbG [Afipia sp.]|jgi:type IV secretion system protein VirB9|nr:P-type conjugative transfer protein TrbG [Afipia sp.]